jgi:hypothetical protein
MTIPRQPIPKKPPIIARVFKKTNNYFEDVGIFLSIKEDFLGWGI